MSVKEDFINSLTANIPSADLPAALQSLWYDKKGDWETAHQLVQDGRNKEESVVHAYLHRKEGDISNALYWYRKAGRSAFKGSLEAEWDDLVVELLT